MSYIEKAKQNKANADKAAAFDAQQKTAREQQVYDKALGDAYTAVEREMMRKAAEQQMQQQMAEAYNRPEFQGPQPTSADWVDGLAGTVRNAGNAVGNWWTNTMNRVNKIDPLTNEPRK
jgi:hypothetical protein